jgi:hypothetical protein
MATKSQASAWNSTDSGQNTAVSNSAHRCPITILEKRIQSMLLSNISYHTHDLLIRGHPQDLPLQPQTVQRGRGLRGEALPCSSSPDKHSRRQVKWCARWGRGGGGGGLLTTDNSTQQHLFLFLLVFLSAVSPTGFDKNVHMLSRTEQYVFISVNLDKLSQE